jgi:hypothetical protein
VELRHPSFDRPLPTEPEAITAAFIADYKEWNDFAFAASGEGEDFDAAEDSYDALIAKYCRPGKRRQGIAFGGDSAHSPETSKIIGVNGKGDRRKVMVREAGAHGYEPTYVFDFVREEERWFLDELYFVDDGAGNRRVKCL